MSSEKMNVALVSLVTSIVLTGAKLTVGLWIGSLALIGDSLHSGTDFLATLLTFLSVRAADKPADDNHTYGHGKYESLAALAEAIMLLVLAGGLGVEAFRSFMDHAPAPTIGPVVIGVMVIEILGNGWRARELARVAKNTNSSALAADALHFASDMASSATVLVGLILAGFGFWWADPLAAAAVSVLIAVLALRLITHTVNELTDAVPPGLVTVLRRTVADVPGVVGVETVKLRKVGAKSFVELTVQVPRTETLERMPLIKSRIKAALQSVLPDAEVTTTTEPIAVTDESVRDRIFLAAARAHVPVHHVTIQRFNQRLAIGLDLEVPAEMHLKDAHSEATRLELSIRDELGGDVEVETHLEPLHPELQRGADVTDGRLFEIAQDLVQAAPSCGITDVHDVRVRETSEGLLVAFHCRMPGDTPVSESHDRLDRLERALRGGWPQIGRIISHPEPQTV